MTTATSSSSICTLDIGGMTCASCVRRVEKALPRVDGVVTRRGQPGHRGRHRQLRPAAASASSELDRRGRRGRLHRHPAPRRRPDDGAAATTRTRRPTADDAQTRSCATLKRRWQVTLAAGLGADGADVRAALPGHHGLADAGDPGRRHRRAVLGRPRHLPRRLGRRPAPLDHHEHPGRARHRRRLRLQRLRHPVARPSPSGGACRCTCTSRPPW